MKKILLFDIDGTLLLTGGCGKIALEKAFEEALGIQNAWGDMMPDGKTDPSIIEEIAQKTLNRKLTTLEHVTLSKLYLTYFRTEIQNALNFKLMPGVPELLSALAGKDEILLGIATGNLEEAGWLKLERGGIRKFFRFGGFGSDSMERSEIIQAAIQRGEKILNQKINLEEVYVIGDTHYDVKAAKKLGLKAIGVTTGSMKEKDFLGEYEPRHLLNDLSDIDLFLSLID